MRGYGVRVWVTCLLVSGVLLAMLRRAEGQEALPREVAGMWRVLPVRSGSACWTEEQAGASGVPVADSSMIVRNGAAANAIRTTTGRAGQLRCIAAAGGALAPTPMNRCPAGQPMTGYSMAIGQGYPDVGDDVQSGDGQYHVRAEEYARQLRAEESLLCAWAMKRAAVARALTVSTWLPTRPSARTLSFSPAPTTLRV